MDKKLLSSSQDITCQQQANDSDPSITSGECIRHILFEGLLPTQEYLDLISSHLPNIQSVFCTENYSVQDLSRLTFDLTAFKKLKSFCIHINTVVEPRYLGNKKAIDYVLLHFSYANGDNAFYTLRERDPSSYQLEAVSQQFTMNCVQNRKIFAKYLISSATTRLKNLCYSRIILM